MKQRLTYAGPGGLWKHHAQSWPMRQAHTHDDLEVNLCLEGRAAYLVDDRRVDLEPGMLLFFHRGEEHILLDEAPDFTMWIAVWRLETVQTAVREGLDAAAAAERPTNLELRRLAGSAHLSLSRLFADLAASDGPALADGCRYLLWRCRAALAAAASLEADSVHAAVAQAVRRLRDDPALSLAQVARDTRAAQSSIQS